jgi:hypothetical protein
MAFEYGGGYIKISKEDIKHPQILLIRKCSPTQNLIRSRNYEETFFNYCEESDKNIYKEIFK